LPWQIAQRPTKRVVVARSVDLHFRRLHTLCGRAVLAPNRHRRDEMPPEPSLWRKQDRSETAYLQGLSTRAATLLEPWTVRVYVSTSID
jgi:hypothetical protein